MASLGETMGGAFGEPPEIGDVFQLPWSPCTDGKRRRAIDPHIEHLELPISYRRLAEQWARQGRPWLATLEWPEGLLLGPWEGTPGNLEDLTSLQKITALSTIAGYLREGIDPPPKRFSEAASHIHIYASLKAELDAHLLPPHMTGGEKEVMYQDNWRQCMAAFEGDRAACLAHAPHICLFSLLWGEMAAMSKDDILSRFLQHYPARRPCDPSASSPRQHPSTTTECLPSPSVSNHLEVCKNCGQDAEAGNLCVDSTSASGYDACLPRLVHQSRAEQNRRKSKRYYSKRKLQRALLQDVLLSFETALQRIDEMGHASTTVGEALRGIVRPTHTTVAPLGEVLKGQVKVAWSARERKRVNKSKHRLAESRRMEQVSCIADLLNRSSVLDRSLLLGGEVHDLLALQDTWTMHRRQWRGLVAAEERLSLRKSQPVARLTRSLKVAP